MSANNLLISPKMLKDRTGIHDNTDEKILSVDIKTAQDMYIHPILGTDLFEKLQSMIPTPTGVYKNLLDAYIVDCLCWYTLVESTASLSYQLANKGLIRKGGENQENASMSELIDISNRFKAKAEFYAERLTMHLKAKYTLYPEYSGNSDIDDLKPDKSAYTCPVWLGDDTDDYCDGRYYKG